MGVYLVIQMVSCWMDTTSLRKARSSQYVVILGECCMTHASRDTLTSSAIFQHITVSLMVVARFCHLPAREKERQAVVVVADFRKYKASFPQKPSSFLTHVDGGTCMSYVLGGR